MGLLNGTTQQQNYDGNDYGNYQFTSLDNIITQFEIAYVGENKILSKVSRTDVQFHAMRAIQELSYDVLKSFKSQEIETWMDCGTPKLLIESAKKIMSSQIILEEKNSFIRSGNVKITQPVFIGKNVKIKDSKIGPFVSIGDDTDISNSNIESTLIYKSVKVSNADIKNSILGAYSVYDGSNKEIFLGDYSQINNNEDNL